MSNQLVSIIIPSFNQGRFIGETIQSCLDQDYRPIEVLVLDGASTDETLDVLHTFDDCPEVTWISEPDAGVVDAVNKGLKRAQGMFAAIQSSDDYYLPGAIRASVEALQRDESLSFVFGDILKVDEQGQELSRKVLGPYSLQNVLSLKTWIPQPSCFFRLAHARQAGGWREAVPYAADTDLWLRMALKGNARKLDCFLARRRMHGAQRDVHGDRILRDYATMTEDLFEKFGADASLRPFAEAGFRQQQTRYGGLDGSGETPLCTKRLTLRQVAGCLLKDAPQSLFARNWMYARNRNNALVLCPAGIDTRPLGNWSQDLYAPKVFPVIGKAIMGRALRQWPIRFSLQRVCPQEPRVTFVIPFRGVERLPLLRLVLQSILAQEGVGVRCLVVEQSAASVIEDLPDAVELLHLPHPVDANSWGKSWAFNAGVRQAKTEFVVCHDADILVPCTYAQNIVQLAEAQSADVLHLQRFLFCLSQGTTKSLLALPPRELRASCSERIRQNWQGGTVALRRQAFLELGGFDESFVNWGGEDNEFYDRCRTRCAYYKGCLPFVHLWHPAQPMKHAAEQNANLAKMRQLLEIEPEERIRRLGGVTEGKKIVLPSSKVTIVFVVYNAAASGAVMDITRRQALALRKQGVKVILATNQPPENWGDIHIIPIPTYDNVFWRCVAYVVNGFGRRFPRALFLEDIRSFMSKYRFGYSAVRHLAQYSEHTRVDGLVLCQHFVALGLSRNRITRSLPFILVAHGDIFEHPEDTFGPLVKNMYRRSAVLAYQKARHCIVVGSSLQKRAIQCGAKVESVSVIPSGMSIEEISGTRNAGGEKRMAQIEILYVGRLSPEKNVATLLKAVAKAGLFSYRVRIAGDGPEKAALVRLTSELDISGQVDFLGIVERTALAALYVSADLFVLPSLSEAQGRVLLEAMLCGVPVIATHVGGVSDTIDNGQTGILVPPGDVEALTLAIRRLAGDPALREALAMAGKQKAIKYDWSHVLDRFCRTVMQGFKSFD